MNEERKSKKGLISILIVAIILIAIICGAIYYFMVYSKTEEIFKRIIDSSINSYHTSEEEEYKTITTKLGANVQVDLEEDNEEVKKIVDMINALDIELDLQMDRENKKMLAKLESNYENEDLLDADLYLDAEKEKLYIGLKDIFDKYIETDIEGEMDESLTEIFEVANTKGSKANIKKSNKILSNELKNVIKTEYCSSEKEEITINNKKMNATKNTISMTLEQFYNEFSTICSNLKNNQEFLNCYEKPDEIKTSIEDILETLEEGKDSISNEDAIIKISVYTTGITHKIVQIDMEVQEDNETIKISITKIDDKNYELKVFEPEVNEIIKANIKQINDETANCIVEVNMEDVGKIVLNLDMSYKINEEIEKFDEGNTIREEDMTQQDYMDIMENFTKSKLYEVINELSGNSLEKMLLGGSSQSNLFDDEDEYSNYFDDEEDL